MGLYRAGVVWAFFPLIIYLVSLRLIPIIFLFGFSLPAYASAMLYNKFFQKLEDHADRGRIGTACSCCGQTDEGRELIVSFNQMLAYMLYGKSGLACSILFAPIEYVEGFIPFNSIKGFDES